ncbi:MAG: DinB family protein [Bacillota bacterium]
MTTTGRSCLQRWQLHRGALLELLDRLPESASGLRIWPGGRSTLELANHVATQAEEFLAPAIGRPGPPTEPLPTLGAVRNHLARQVEELGAELLKLSPAELTRMVKVPRQNLTAPAAELIHLHIQHEAYHLGQLIYHARLLGIHPPFYAQNLWNFASAENWGESPKGVTSVKPCVE